MLNDSIQRPWSHVRTGILRAGVVVAAFFIALSFGRHLLATRFEAYDDEGYMLLMFQHYFSGGHLYTQVFSQYGPFAFFAEGTLFHLLHLPVNHDSGRFVTLIWWLVAAALGGCFAYRLSRSTILGSAAGLATMATGRVLSMEPVHPQQLILPLLMLACCVSVAPGRIALILLGALGAALFFTKINVGVFYFAALAITLVCTFPAGRIRTLGAVLFFFYTIGGPLMLMRRDVMGWAGGYCVLAVACGAATLAMGLFTTPSSPAPMRDVLYVASGALSTGAIIVAGSLMDGISIPTLIRGVLLDPLRQPQVLDYALEISKIEALFAMLVSACIVGLYRYRDRWRAHSEWVDAVRCLVGLWAISQISIFRTHYFFVAFLPLGLLPAKGRAWGPANVFPRLFVTSLAAAQFLQAYPVAGSQLNIAYSPALLWAFICVHDGAGGLFFVLRRAGDWIGDNLPRQESILGALVALALIVAMFRSGGWPQSYPDPPSHLRGASSLHLPKNQEDLYESLASNIRANCAVLFTLPGMGSLNFWSGVPTPNGLNMTGWMRAFSLEQEQQILHILELNPKSCVVYNEKLLHFWGSKQQDLDALPLGRYILYTMPEVFQEDGYEIRVNPQRKSPWIDTVARPSP